MSQVSRRRRPKALSAGGSRPRRHNQGDGAPRSSEGAIRRTHSLNVTPLDGGAGDGAGPPNGRPRSRQRGYNLRESTTLRSAGSHGAGILGSGGSGGSRRPAKRTRSKKRADVVRRVLKVAGSHTNHAWGTPSAAASSKPSRRQGQGQGQGHGRGRRGSKGGSDDGPLDVEVRQVLDKLLRVGVARVEDLTLLRKVRGREVHVDAHDFHRLSLETRFREEWRVEQEDGLLATVRSRGYMDTFTPTRLVRYLNQFAAAVASTYSHHQAALFDRTSDERAPQLHREGSASSGGRGRGSSATVGGDGASRRKSSALTALEDHIQRMRTAFQSHLKLIETPLNPTEVELLRADLADAQRRLDAAAKPPPPPTHQPSSAAPSAPPAAGDNPRARPSRPGASLRRRPSSPRVAAGSSDSHAAARDAKRAAREQAKAERRAEEIAEQARAAAAAKAAEDRRLVEEAMRETERRYEAVRLLQRIMRGALGRQRVRPLRNARKLREVSLKFWLLRLQKWVRVHLRWRHWVRVWKAHCAAWVVRDQRALILWHTATGNARARRQALAHACDFPSAPRPPFTGPYPNYRALKRHLKQAAGLPAHLAAKGVGAAAHTDAASAAVRAPSPGPASPDGRGSPLGVPSSVLRAAIVAMTSADIKAVTRWEPGSKVTAVAALSSSEQGLVMWDAAAAIQAAARGFLAKRRLQHRRDAVAQLQKFATMARYRMIMWWQRKFSLLAQRRQEQLLWQESRSLSLRTWPVEQGEYAWLWLASGVPFT